MQLPYKTWPEQTFEAKSRLMHKLVILFNQPPDVEQFEDRWSEEFVPQAEKMPGIKRIAVSRVHGTPEGEGRIYMLHEFFFSDEAGLFAALESPEGQAAGRSLMSIAGPFASLHFAEHLEEDRP